MKKLLANIILFVFLIFIGGNIQAASSLKAEVNPSVNELKAGQEVMLTLKFNQYQEIDKGINAYKATLKYDEEVFEAVKQEDFTSLNNWEQLEYNPKTGEFVAIKRAGSKMSEEIVQVKLKLKEKVKPQETEIQMKDIVTSQGKYDICAMDAKTTINIIKEQTEKPTTPTNPGAIDNNQNNQQNGGKKQDTTFATNKIPKSGNRQTQITLIIAL